MSLDELKAAAVAMLDRAYCPYSHFPVDRKSTRLNSSHAT